MSEENVEFVRRGLVAVAQAMRRFAEVWETSRHELRELYDCGDAVVAAVNWHYAAGEAGGSASTRRPTPSGRQEGAGSAVRARVSSSSASSGALTPRGRTLTGQYDSAVTRCDTLPSSTALNGP